MLIHYFLWYKKGRHSTFSKQPKPIKMNFLFTLLLLGCTVQSFAKSAEEETLASLYRRSPSRRTHDEGSGAAPPPPLPHRFTIPSMLTSGDGPAHDEDSGADPPPPLPHRFTIPSMLNSDEPSATADLPLPPLVGVVRPGAVYIAHDPGFLLQTGIHRPLGILPPQPPQPNDADQGDTDEPNAERGPFVVDDASLVTVYDAVIPPKKSTLKKALKKAKKCLGACLKKRPE
jgi:hypothetical protein